MSEHLLVELSILHGEDRWREHREGLGLDESCGVEHERNGRGLAPGYTRQPMGRLELAPLLLTWVRFYSAFLSLLSDARTGAAFAKRLDEACIEATRHRALHTSFTNSFEPELVQTWSAMLDTWTKDPRNAPNPFNEPAAGEYWFILVTARD